MPGPVPERSDRRRRRNKPDGVDVTKAKAEEAGPWPAADADWHPIAKLFYASLQKSGQAVFYQASDIAEAVYVTEAMSRSLAGGRMSGQMFAAVMAAMTGLGVDEASRRRMRMELQREPDAKPADVISIYREALGD